MPTRNKSNKEILDTLLNPEGAQSGRWVRTESGGEVWVPDSAEETGVLLWQRNKRIDEIERYLRS